MSSRAPGGRCAARGAGGPLARLLDDHSSSATAPRRRISTKPATIAMTTIAPMTRSVVLSDVAVAGAPSEAGAGVAAPALAPAEDAGSDAAGDGLGAMLASVRSV